MKALARLSLAAVFLTWALLVVGAVVRVTGSGMGCPDWPRCFGQWLPPPTFAAWIEWTHRLLAALVSPLILASAVVAWRQRGRRPGGAPSVWAPATLAVGLLASQIAIGALTVRQGNSPASVIAHLMNALLLLGALAVAWVRASREGRAVDDATVSEDATGREALTSSRRGPEAALRLARQGSVSRLGLAAAATTLVLSLAGSIVQTTGGGFACPSFPLCNGYLWPTALGWPAEVHMVHRALAVGLGLLLGSLWLALRPGSDQGASAGAGSNDRRSPAPDPSQRSLTLLKLATLLYGLQFIVGVAQVVTALPIVLRGAHVALAGALWLAVVALATELVDARGLAMATVRATKGSSPPKDASRNKRGSPQINQISRRGDVTVSHAHPSQDNNLRNLRNLRINCLTRPKEVVHHAASATRGAASAADERRVGGEQHAGI